MATSKSNEYLNGLESTTCYDRELGELLRAILAQDIESAELALEFRMFYRIRPYLPDSVRLFVQRARSRLITTDEVWYIHKQLLKALASLEQPLTTLWPKNAEYALVLSHDVESQSGFSQIAKLAEVEESMGLRSSWNIVPYKYKIDRGLINDLKQRGHEIAIHGYNHDGRLFSSKEVFDYRVPMINRAIEELEAVGFRAPMVHRNLRWMQQLNIEYDSSCFDIDPFQAMPGGVGSIWPFSVGKFVELPYTMPQDHTLFVSLSENSDRIWREKLAFIKRHHGMALMLTHPDYLDSPSRLRIYRDFLKWLRDSSEPWHVLPREMSAWYRKLHPPTF